MTLVWFGFNKPQFWFAGFLVSNQTKHITRLSSMRRTWVELNTTETGERHVQPVSNELAKIAWGSVRCSAAPFVQQILYGGCICEDDDGILAYRVVERVGRVGISAAVADILQSVK
ncbi:hypothetical protein DFH08DRAFT_824957 [Mycena albidolilacea]|uniref:Uncharacterized protein n=1 Tax=Mycena albidolilacea TaxID=1033008 RepID=A0AAD6Z434_9AGAR|nr:hypothetical protein DFH08DRAFT_824957 [Mycena albidolilacea]